MSTTKLNHRRFANTKHKSMEQKHKRMKQKYKGGQRKHKREQRKHKRKQRPKKRRQPKRTTESNLRMMTITIVLPPSNLTLASTKLDVCHRLTQRVPPPSLMTVSACPESKFRKHKSHSPHPNPTALSPKRGYGSTETVFRLFTIHIYEGTKKHVNSTQNPTFNHTFR